MKKLHHLLVINRNHHRIFFLLLFLCSSISIYGIVFVDFDSGMSNSVRYPSFKNDANWQLVKSAYEKNCAIQLYQSEPKIPKIIHHIWLGSPFPQRCIELRNQWIEFHPDWQCILWTDKEIQEFGLSNLHAYKTACSYGEKSDIARYEILYRMGGLYVDTDFQCNITFDELHHRFHFYIGVLHSDQVEINNALIGSMPGHPVLEKIITHIKNDNGPRPRIPMSVLSRTGSYMITKYILSMDLTDQNHSILVLPVNFFYPVPSHYKNEPQARFLKPETMAIHLWACSWM